MGVVIKALSDKLVVSYIHRQNDENKARYNSHKCLQSVIIDLKKVVSASPCDTYGIDFVLYQFFMGLGDAIPIILLCVLVCGFVRINTGDRKPKSPNKKLENRIMFIVISLLFFIERVVGYYVGYIDNEFQEYPIPVLIWTLVFGMVMGGIYVFLSPIYEDIKGDT